ncbi:hypothetical protein BsWGS_14259 [Bradybaena similaris]
MFDVLTLYNGYWDNEYQLEHGGQDHDHVQCWITPVDVPALSPNPVVLVRQLKNGKLGVFTLGEFVDGVEENSVIMKIHNFSGITTDKNGMFDLEKLKTLKRENIQEIEDCFAEFILVDRAYISGNYAYCNVKVNGQYPRISVTIDCDSATVTFPSGSMRKTPMGPYVFPLVGRRYPLINPPKEYVSICRNKELATQREHNLFSVKT